MGEAAKAEKPRAVMLVPNRIGTQEVRRNHWVATAESGEFPSDFLKPDYWALVAKDFRPFDIVEVNTDDGTYWGEFLVVACDRTWAKCKLLREFSLQTEVPATEIPEFKIEWKGAHKKWCVIRDSDKSIVHEGEQEKIDAARWLEGYARTVGASRTKPA